MHTKMGLFCEKVIEAGLLILAALIPLFFNPSSWTVFEADKIAILRAITLIMALAWAIKTVEEGALWKRVGVLRQSLRTPLVIPALLFVGAIIMATITSVAPRLSLWGSYHRREGAYTILCYVALFFLGLGALRRPRQIERIITATLMASLPISLYAIMQHYGLDPMPWQGRGAEVTFRATSTQGNAIFLAAYLIMVIPLTVARLFDSFPVSSGKVTLSSIRLLFYALLLSVQLLALFFTQSRGPLLGLIGGMSCFFLLWAGVRGRRRWIAAVIGVVAGLLLLLILLNMPGSPLAPLRELPYLARLGQLLNPQAWGTRDRILGWELVSHLVTADPVRTVVGYGPDTLIVTFYPYLSKELASLLGLMGKSFLDRAHNRVFDIMVSAGVLGLAAYLLLIGSIFYYGLKWLGLLWGPRQRSLFAPSLTLGGLLGLLLPLLLDRSLKFAGVGIALGMVGAWGIFLVISALLYGKSEKTEWRGTTPLILIALLSALTAHFIEVQFGIATASTNTLFWLFAAMAVVLGGCLHKEQVLHTPDATAISSATRKVRSRRKRRRRTQPLPKRRILRPEHIPVVAYSLLSGLILTTLIYAFASSRVDLSQHHASGIWLLLLTWVLLGVLAATISAAGSSRQDATEWASLLGLSLLLSGGCLLLFEVFYHSMARSNGQGTQAIAAVSLWLLFSLVALGAVLTREAAGPALAWQKSRWWVYALLIMVTMALAIGTNFSIIVADVYYKQSVLLARKNQWELAISYCKKAAEAAPHQAMYYQRLAEAYLERWRSASQRQGTWLQEGREALEQAAKISPLTPDSLAHLGSFYLLSAETLCKPPKREEYLRRASDYYQRAASLSPWPADVYREWGQAYYDLGQYEEAIERYHQALGFDEKNVETLLALEEAYEALGDLNQAIEACQQAIKADPNSAKAYHYLGYVYYLKGEMEQAIEAELKAAELKPDEYLVHRNLVVFYAKSGQLDKALAEAQLALRLAPDSERASLEAYIAKIRQRLAPEEHATEGQGGD